MAKRFTCTDKWKKPFLRSLETPYKLLWFYILDDCDHAGIWQVDIDVAQIRTGEKFELKKALENFGEKIISFDNDEKWFVPDFIEFQYGILNPENRVHKSILNLLEKYNIKGLISTLEGAKDKDKVKDKVKETEKVKEKDIPSLEDFLTHCKVALQTRYLEYEFSLISKYQTWVDDGWKTGHGKPIKNWKNTINNTIPHLKPIKNNNNGHKTTEARKERLRNIGKLIDERFPDDNTGSIPK